MQITLRTGEQKRTRFVRHLKTLDDFIDGPLSIDLYEIKGSRRLVVCTVPANDSRAIPEEDPESTPDDYPA